jgi:hypothetical protein
MYPHPIEQQSDNSRSGQPNEPTRQEIGPLAMQAERFKRLAAALESFVPTGDLAQDARSYFKTVEGNPEALEPRYAEAIRNEDRSIILEFFRNLDKQLGQSDPERYGSLGDAGRIWSEALVKAVKSIIAKATESGPQ